MMKSVAILLVALFVFLTTLPALALEDTPANRAQQADIYLRAVPPQSMMKDVAIKVAATMPESQRAAFLDILTKNLDINALSALIRAALIKNFTADELKALADFYGSQVGQSAMAKMGNYMADVQPGLITEVRKAQDLTMQQMKAR
ncbi:DUF2059 domain-containing protein [Bradyrhizobium diazoefficiens]|nr:DUF2059 domain-containing protein [Bradyrhizobium diazoefficiens]MBR0774767.1 DUF2059 domain-containing protein [Bradyrhizobium diazoefficiens]